LARRHAGRRAATDPAQTTLHERLAAAITEAVTNRTIQARAEALG